MISDDERRNLAESLRQLGNRQYAPDGVWERFERAFGRKFDNVAELFQLLADYIEPSYDWENTVLSIVDLMEGSRFEYSGKDERCRYAIDFTNQMVGWYADGIREAIEKKDDND